MFALTNFYYTIYPLFPQEKVPASDFRCSQTALEKKYNVGRIRVKGTIFCFYGVQNFAETKGYIQENFPTY